MSDITALAATLKRAAQEELMCREASDTSDLWQDEAGPENILALVEALEKAQKLATQQGNIACALFDEVAAQRHRIAELESRTVTVKLPEEKFCPSEYAGSQYWEETEVWNKAISACAVAIRAAGIGVKEE